MITSYVFKSIQIGVFLILILLLWINRCKKKSHIGKLPILISVLALLNGIFAIIRINAFFPSYSKDDQITLGKVFFCLDVTCFFGSNWFFCIKYFETAYDIKCMLESGFEGSKRR